MTSTNRVEAIRRLNDLSRTLQGLAPNTRVMITRGLAASGEDFAARALAAARTFNTFTTDNDPHGEHDFGAFAVDGEKCFWKIDCYDKSLEHGSEDPADPDLTTRVLTIMLAEEY